MKTRNTSYTVTARATRSGTNSTYDGLQFQTYNFKGMRYIDHCVDKIRCHKCHYPKLTTEGAPNTHHFLNLRKYKEWR